MVLGRATLWLLPPSPSSSAPLGGLPPPGPFFCSNYLSPGAAPALPALLPSLINLSKLCFFAGLGLRHCGEEEEREEHERCNYSLPRCRGPRAV